MNAGVHLGNAGVCPGNVIKPLQGLRDATESVFLNNECPTGNYQWVNDTIDPFANKEII